MLGARLGHLPGGRTYWDGLSGWGGYALHICHVGLRVALWREEVAVACNTTFKGREGAASAVGTVPILVDRGSCSCGGAVLPAVPKACTILPDGSTVTVVLEVMVGVGRLRPHPGQYLPNSSHFFERVFTHHVPPFLLVFPWSFCGFPGFFCAV